jgi:hypothetical protein
VEVNQDFEVVGPSPTNCLVEVIGLALNVRLAARDIVCPVRHRNSNVVKSGSWSTLAKR